MSGSPFCCLTVSLLLKLPILIIAHPTGPSLYGIPVVCQVFYGGISFIHHHNPVSKDIIPYFTEKEKKLREVK